MKNTALLTIAEILSSIGLDPDQYLDQYGVAKLVPSSWAWAIERAGSQGNSGIAGRTFVACSGPGLIGFSFDAFAPGGNRWPVYLSLVPARYSSTEREGLQLIQTA